MVRAAGLEPAHQAWKACVLALVLCPQRVQSLTIIPEKFPNARNYLPIGGKHVMPSLLQQLKPLSPKSV